jgi:hypothetical protein
VPLYILLWTNDYVLLRVTIKPLLHSALFLLLISLAGPSYAQAQQVQRDAIFDGKTIFIPMISVGDDYYNIKFSLMDNANFVDLEVTEVIKINPLNGSGSSTFDAATGSLHVPSLIVGEKKYWANFSLIDDSPVVFRFLDAGLVGNANNSSLEKGVGIFTGYLSMNINAPQSYGYGFSLYSNTTFLFNEDIAGSQVGLPSSWIIPYNYDFYNPLCPKGTTAGDNWPERSPNYYREVFQTIEGGLGTWTSTRFGTNNPKYRINGTPNCYSNQIASPGWGWGTSSALSKPLLSIAQLSNRLIVPPDGVTMAKNTRGTFLGIAWMALPLVDARETEREDGTNLSIGSNSWTLFLKAENFSGPVAFWLPEIWAQLSSSYPTIEKRGLDFRLGQMRSGAMEFGALPYYQQRSEAGNKIFKIPKLTFPITESNKTVLMQNVKAYNEKALYEKMKLWFSVSTTNIDSRFDDNGGIVPDCRVNDLSFKIGQSGSRATVGGYESSVETYLLKDSCGYGLLWNESPGEFPQYYAANSGAATPMDAEDMDAGFSLLSKKFDRKLAPGKYVSAGAACWDIAAAVAGPFSVLLSDESELTYSWYRFIDQPTIKCSSMSDNEKQELQRRVELIHKNWSAEDQYFPDPSVGFKTKLDDAVLVNPPSGFEVGYVPVVISQTSPDTDGDGRDDNEDQFPMDPNDWVDADGDGLADSYQFKSLVTSDLLGTYIRTPRTNNYHEGVITDKDGLKWENSAGVIWGLDESGLTSGSLKTIGSPYSQSPGGNEFQVVLGVDPMNPTRRIISGFRFMSEFYIKQ